MTFIVCSTLAQDAFINQRQQYPCFLGPSMRFFGHDRKEMRMSETVLAALSNIRTTEEMIVAFRDE
ncbi:hypothetical protein, partial [Mesorhizobium sp. M0019]|uniref:hypothetical protein n=1 Tax=Mesorhizobium sp. M0019 TaxID=2956845 RepID=UPI0033394A22